MQWPLKLPATLVAYTVVIGSACNAHNVVTKNANCFGLVAHKVQTSVSYRIGDCCLVVSGFLLLCRPASYKGHGPQLSLRLILLVGVLLVVVGERFGL